MEQHVSAFDLTLLALQKQNGADAFLVWDPVYANWEARMGPFPALGCDCFSPFDSSDAAIRQLRELGAQRIVVLFVSNDGRRRVTNGSGWPLLVIE